MSLTYSSEALAVASVFSWSIPLAAGLLRGLFRKTGNWLLLLVFTSLVGWMSLNFANLIYVWKAELSIEMAQASGRTVPSKAMEAYTNDGGSNTFAVLLGWLPAALIYFAGFGGGHLGKRILHFKAPGSISHKA